MNLLKIITASLLIGIGMILVSIEFSTGIAGWAHFIVFVNYAILMYCLANFTNLFKIEMVYTTANLDLDLARFLHDNGVLDLFLERLNQQQKSNGRDVATIETLDWEATPEGRYFWFNLNEDFKRLNSL